MSDEQKSPDWRPLRGSGEMSSFEKMIQQKFNSLFSGRKPKKSISSSRAAKVKVVK